MWIEPKTNWNASDYFNAEDYNRIKGNIAHVAAFASSLYRLSGIDDMGSDKTVSDYYYADEINTITANLETIVQGIYPLEIGSRTVYYDNGAFVAWEDLNRIESATKIIYELLAAQQNAQSRLAFRLGSRKGEKC